MSDSAASYNFPNSFSSVSVYALIMEKKNMRRHILKREGPEQVKGDDYFLILMFLTLLSASLTHPPVNSVVTCAKN